MCRNAAPLSGFCGITGRLNAQTTMAGRSFCGHCRRVLVVLSRDRGFSAFPRRGVSGVGTTRPAVRLHVVKSLRRLEKSRAVETYRREHARRNTSHGFAV